MLIFCPVFTGWQPCSVVLLFLDQKITFYLSSKFKIKIISGVEREGGQGFLLLDKCISKDRQGAG